MSVQTKRELIPSKLKECVVGNERGHPDYATHTPQEVELASSALYPTQTVTESRKGDLAFYVRRDFSVPSFDGEEQEPRDGFYAEYKRDGRIVTCFSGDMKQGEDFRENAYPVARELADTVLEQGIVSFPPRGLYTGKGFSFGMVHDTIILGVLALGGVTDVGLELYYDHIGSDYIMFDERLMEYFTSSTNYDPKTALGATGLVGLGALACVFGGLPLLARKLEGAADRYRTRNLPEIAETYQYGKDALDNLVLEHKMSKLTPGSVELYQKLREGGVRLSDDVFFVWNSIFTVRPEDIPGKFKIEHLAGIRDEDIPALSRITIEHFGGMRLSELHRHE